ncbi:hypothetical protein BDR05DRAFT_978559 [Suillus weaverae]|nr:hypothetical protein BDR05DRAFT_978559 [Suillus weaverae]
MGWTDKDLEELYRMAHLKDAQDALSFITALQKASLDDPCTHLPPDAIDRLRNPPHELPDTTDPDLILSLKYYFADLTVNAYNLICEATMQRHPKDDIYSHYCMKGAVTKLSGVVPITHDMCINTCLAFTGPFADLDQCSRSKKVAHQTFDTFPVGPQLQALWHHPDHHTQKILEELRITGGIPEVYEDILHGKQYLEAYQSGKIKEGDSVLMLSIDGAQLYKLKQFDCWVYIWVLFDHAPDEHYQKKYVLPGGLIIWDGAHEISFTSHPFLFVATADGPGMAFLTGLVGHHGKMGCCLYCRLCDAHPDVPINHIPSAGSFNYKHNLEHIIQCRNMAKYEQACLETGITKSSIFCADPTDDKSHWNWAVLTKETWKAHGTVIADATSFLPGSFDCPPSWEWLLYLYGMGPATLYGILPNPYWTNLCNLVRGMCLMQQYHIPRTDLVEGHRHLLTFLLQFEEIYYQPNKGLPICSSQWIMEQTIGNLAQEICLHNASIYANLSQRAAHQCQINAIKAIIPSNAILRYLAANGIHVTSAPPVTRWAHLRLPNGQVHFSITIAEVLFYFNMSIHNEEKTFALVSEFGSPHPELLESSFQTIFACLFTVQSVVAIIPHQFLGIAGVLFYLVERPGLDIVKMSGIEEHIPDEA